MSTTLPHPTFRGLADIDWDDTASILRHASPIFGAFVAEPDLLVSILDNLEVDDHLRSMCEGYDFMDKLVLYDDREQQVRARLHLYRPGYFDRPHNHRWSFASHILRGSYVHRIFGRDDHFGEDTDVDTLRPIHERVEGNGATYALHHTSVHAVHAAADTVSIMLRGPAAKDRFLVLDRSGPSFWVYGAAQESAEIRAGKQMPASKLAETIARARELTTRTALAAEPAASQ